LGNYQDGENCAVLDYYTARSGMSLPTFQNNLSIPSVAQKSAAPIYLTVEPWVTRYQDGSRTLYTILSIS